MDLCDHELGRRSSTLWFQGQRTSSIVLETDFERRLVPQRRIQLKNEANQNTGVSLKKYEIPYHLVVALLAKDLTGNGDARSRSPESVTRRL
jgi:hypothetical protein